jgi:stage II sporulation protein D
MRGYPPLLWACALLLAALMPAVWRWLAPGAKSVGDRPVALFDVRTNVLLNLPLEEYLIGVVAAEMPASYAPQALCAQAVAARTRAVASLRASGGAGCAPHPGADICSDSTHCQAWTDDDALRARWGADYATYRRKVAEAVEATGGEVLTYEGAPILVLYHAVSGGATEDVEHVFAQALPYLRGVESPGEEGARRYESETRLPYRQAAETLNAAFPGAGLTAGALPGALEVTQRFDSGRVSAVRVGGVIADGRGVRQALGLASANFTLAFGDGELVIRQRGYGHGVGMSQAGAEAMARAGYGYADILGHYFTGVEIRRW